MAVDLTTRDVAVNSQTSRTHNSPCLYGSAMHLGERIEELLRERGWSQAQLARRIGVSQQTIWKLVNGTSSTTKHLRKIAIELKTSEEYLLGETDDPSPDPTLQERQLEWRGPPMQPGGDVVELEEFDVSFGLGSSFIHDVPVTGTKRVFSRAWIRQFTQSPLEYLFFATGTGDSMVPTIQDADVVLIDSYDRTPRFADKIWAVELGGLGAIKRLRPTRDGTGMKLISSNPEVPEEVAYDDEMRIVGRVAAVFRKM